MNNRIKHFLDLLWEMTLKELRLRYKNTSLGFLWVIIYPIIQALIIGYIFEYLFTVNDPMYKYSLFLNLLIWNFFSTSLENATPSIVRGRTIVKKARFPYSVIPLSAIFSNAIHFFFSLILFELFLVAFNITQLFNVPLVLVGCLFLFSLTSGLSLITSALNVKVRDVSFLIRAILMVWFYATPIVYSVSKIPAEIKYIWHINPLTEVVMLFQKSFLNSQIDYSFIVTNSLAILVLLWAGIFVFSYFEKNFGDYL